MPIKANTVRNCADDRGRGEEIHGGALTNADKQGCDGTLLCVPIKKSYNGGIMGKTTKRVKNANQLAEFKARGKHNRGHNRTNGRKEPNPNIWALFNQISKDNRKRGAQ